MMKVLSFGHIPSSVGGCQSSGLANVIYNLSLFLSKQKDIDITLAATDIYESQKIINGLKVIGWTKSLLLNHILRHPIRTANIAFKTILSKVKYSQLVSIPSLFIKSVFLDYAIFSTRPDIIHLHGANSVLYYQIIPKACKLVVTLHGNIGNDDNLPNKDMHFKIEKDCCMSHRIDTLCTISSRIPVILKDMYTRIAPPIKVILNAFDHKSFYYIDHIEHDKLVLCTIASYSKVKGQERVLEALINSGLNYKYKCIGYFNNSDKAKFELKASNKVDIECLGVKKPAEIRQILAECDYMILPSSSEGFGLVYLEAIACGVPIIIPKNLPLSLEKNILNESNSIMIDDCSIEAISKILPSLKDKKWNHKEVSSTVISYTWDNIADEYAQLYKSLIS